MPTGILLRSRLTLWSFVLLTLLLGAGGFFCYRYQQRQLLENLDQQLVAHARTFACSYRGALPDNSNREQFCNNFERQAIQNAGHLAVALYAPGGAPLCSNRHPYRKLLRLSPEDENRSAAGSAFFETLTGDDGPIRRLTFPIIENDRLRFHLQIAKSLADVEEELANYFLSLLCGGVLIAGLLTAAQWVLLGLFTRPLKQLSWQLEQTGEEQLAQPLRLPAFYGSEIRQLGDSFNRRIERLNDALQRARQFATDVTHELRTPLTILRGETELAIRGDHDAPQLQQILNSNLEEITRMSHLVEDLLLLSKSEQGEIPLKMEALNLNEMLQELYEQGQIIAEPKQIRVQLIAPQQQVSLYADANRIRQVFLNLMTNGIKYTPEGGSVTIDWSLQDERVRIIFRDTGIGIDAKHQQHIFDRFYRIDKTGNRNDGGSGLGLAISKWLVEAHGGSLRVCSAPGQGSSFAVTLPLTHKPSQPSKIS